MTGTGLVHLRGLTKLQSLNLMDTPVTEAALEGLEGLTNLQSLDLWNTNVTDAGLVHVKGLNKLQLMEPAGNQGDRRRAEASERVDRTSTAVDRKHPKLLTLGIKELQKVLPNCSIHRLFGKS